MATLPKFIGRAPSPRVVYLTQHCENVHMVKAICALNSYKNTNNMKRLLCAVAALCVLATAQAQTTPPKRELRGVWLSTHLGLDWPVSLDVLKTRYKELAKRHHPDANGGDRASEERLKTINLAYAAIRQHLTDEPRMAAAG